MTQKKEVGGQLRMGMLRIRMDSRLAVCYVTLGLVAYGLDHKR